MLGFPAVTLRDSIERPEALDTGAIIMTGLDSESVVEAVGVRTADSLAMGASLPQDYSYANTSERAVRFILSTWRRHAAWSGLRSASVAGGESHR